MARSCKFRRGSSMLEFAIAAGVLVPAFVGTFQFGYTFFTYDNLDTAIRGGARYASMRSYDSNNATPSSAFLTAVQNMVVYGNSAGTGNPVVAGLVPGNVQVLPVMNGKVPRAMTVQITGYQVDAIFKKFTFNAKPSTTFPYTGTAAPF